MHVAKKVIKVLRVKVGDEDAGGEGSVTGKDEDESWRIVLEEWSGIVLGWEVWCWVGCSCFVWVWGVLEGFRKLVEGWYWVGCSCLLWICGVLEGYWLGKEGLEVWCWVGCSCESWIWGVLVGYRFGKEGLNCLVVVVLKVEEGNLLGDDSSLLSSM